MAMIIFLDNAIDRCNHHTKKSLRFFRSIADFINILEVRNFPIYFFSLHIYVHKGVVWQWLRGNGMTFLDGNAHIAG